jgi:uncharacterized membrane protein YecN with MAPEG domain
MNRGRSPLSRIAAWVVCACLLLGPVVVHEFFPQATIAGRSAGTVAVAASMAVMGLRTLFVVLFRVPRQDPPES